MGDLDNLGPRRVQGEVLPTSPTSPNLPPDVSHLPRGFLGMALTARARYASETKQIEAFHRFVSAKNQLLIALNEQQQGIEQHVRGNARLEHLPAIKAAAGLNALADLELAQQRLAGLRVSGEIAALDRHIERKRKELELARLTKEQEDWEAGRARSNANTVAERFDQAAKEIDEIEAAYQKRYRDEVARAGGEDRLDAEVRTRLQRWKQLKADLLQNVMEALL